VDRFIVGTGRCGSTLLSQMLAEHPGALSIFELFNGLDVSRRFAPEPIDGREFGALIAAEQPFVTAVLRRGYPVAEITYPFDAGGRYRRDEPLPWILVSLLPRLSDDPDALFDDVMARVAQQPRQPAVAHYRQLFDWLVERLGRRFWLERSGSSIDYLGALVEHFPDARFVHIHRDGREAALSMREYPVLRVAVAVMYGLLGEVEYSHDGLVKLERDEPAAIDRLLETRPPIELYGRYWSDQIRRGHAALQSLAPDDFLDVRFEELVTRPREVVRRIAEFLEIGAEDEWIARAAALVRGVPERRQPALAPDESERLDAACRDAMTLLGRPL